jgi:hypothetical protein
LFCGALVFPQGGGGGGGGRDSLVPFSDYRFSGKEISYILFVKL